MGSEVANRADFSVVRYAQCWEDADVLLEALDVREGDRCLSIASAGDNTLALLTRRPERVVAVDLNPVQLACLELRVAAYRELEHGELLELIGSKESQRRDALYRRCRALLSRPAREFWDSQPEAIAGGIGGAGKLERYFQLFRRRLLPFVHSRARIDALLRGGTRDERLRFYERRWNSWRWRMLFRVFFSPRVMSRLGRDPAFFKYAEIDAATMFAARGRHVVTELNPADNPYLQWLLTGRHLTALPLALRPEHFDTIRNHLDRLEWHQSSLEDFVARQDPASFDRFNLSDVFEYMSPENTQRLLSAIATVGRRGGRLAYWNTLVRRSREAELADRLRSLDALAERLHAADKVCFYTRFVVEEIVE